MNPRVTFGLLAVLLALGGYLYFGGGPASSGSSATKPGAKPGVASKDTPADPALDLLTFDDREAQRLVVRGSGREVAIEKTAEGTWVLQPGGEPADRMRVNGLLLRLANLRATRRIEAPPNLADYGLATPALGATIAVAGTPDATLALGGRAPAEAGTYVQKAGDSAVYLIANTVAQDLERMLNEPPLQPPPTPAPSPQPEPAPSP